MMKTNTLPETFPPGFLLTITDKGAARVAEVIGQYKLPEGAGLRAGVTEGGCSGLNYDVQVAEEPNPDETVFVLNGTNIFVNALSAQYISGMTIDWTSSMQESRFVFNNPNATGGCGCGVSFTVK